MVVLLVTVEARNLGRGLQWTVMYRDQVNGMRAGLEAYKSSLEIALELGSTLLITSVQKTTDATRRDVALIRQDMAQVTRLVAGTRALRMQFHQLEEQGVGISIPLQRFLDETESYAESVRAPDDLSEAEWEGRTVIAESRHVAGALDPLAGGSNNDIARSTLAVSRGAVHSQPNSSPSDKNYDVSRHLSGKFAAFVYVVPLLQADADRCLAHRNALNRTARNLLDAKLKTAVSDTSRQPLAVIKDLVEQGADVTMALRSELETKLYPRHDIVFYLISMGSTVDLNAQISHHRNCADIFRFLLHQKLCNLEAINKPGYKNVLHSAMGHDTHRMEHDEFVPASPEAIEVLCEHGADVNYGSQSGDPPLHAALYLADKGWGVGSKSEFVRVLLEWGAGPLVLGNYKRSALDVVEVMEEDGRGRVKPKYREYRKLLEAYVSGQIEPKHNYYPGRPCSCRFTPASATSNANREQSQPSSNSLMRRFLGKKKK